MFVILFLLLLPWESRRPSVPSNGCGGGGSLGGSELIDWRSGRSGTGGKWSSVGDPPRLDTLDRVPNGTPAPVLGKGGRQMF